MKPESAKIISNLERLVKSERKIMHEVLVHIVEVEKRRLFLELGYSSIYKFLTQHLGYSEDAAYDRMAGARMLSKAPEIVTKLEEGSLNLTQLVKLNQCLQQEKKMGQPVTAKKTQELITQIENKTNFETEKILAVALQQAPATYQKIKPQADDSVRVELTFTAEEFATLKQAQSLLSHIVTDNDLAKAIVHLATNLVQKFHGKNKVDRRKENFELSQYDSNKSQKESPKLEPNPHLQLLQQPTPPRQTASSPAPVPPTTRRLRVKRKFRRRRLLAAVTRAVYGRARNCCQHIHPESKRRCSSTYQLQVDHIIPVACGGSDELENLRLLCGVHNRFEALQWGLNKL